MHSPLKLEAAMNLLMAQIQDLSKTIEYTSKDGLTFVLADLKAKRKHYVKSLKRLTRKRMELEFEAERAAETLKLLVPEYRGTLCADYQVPKGLLKYCKLDYNDRQTEID